MNGTRKLALAALFALSMPWASAQAGVRIGVRIGFPLCFPCYRPRVYVGPAPVYVVQPAQPVYVQQAPVVYQAPAAPAFATPVPGGQPAILQPVPAPAGAYRP